MLNDTLADALSAIKNAEMVGKFEVVNISIPRFLAGRYLDSHFSNSLTFTENLGLITPHLFIRPFNLTMNLPDFPSSMNSNSSIYS